MAEQTDAQIWHRWNSELEFALKDKTYDAWIKRSEKIVKRYRDQRDDATSSKARRLNILWSNVQTLKPAVLARPPKALAERRFLDRDPVGRLASMVLERCLNNQIEKGYLFESASMGVIDHLLCGMGVIWPRYEPQFEPAEDASANKKVDSREGTAEQVEEEGDGKPYEKVASERVCVDYVFWKDFLWGPARFWREVPWVARRCWKTRSEIAEEYYSRDAEGNRTAPDMEKAQLISLDYSPKVNKASDDTTAGYFRKAEIWQFWNKADQTVYDIAPGTADIVLRKEPKPVLDLEEFWPPARPAFATQTNETVVPVPDYVQYQDQAAELDDLTNRIAALTTAMKVAGVYDASIKELARLLQTGEDNKLIPVDQWAMFAEKGGIPGAISLVPLKEIGAALLGLYDARSQVKADLYEVTGMSDIVRGQGEQNETATAQRIKGQFASMRLEDRRVVVNDWLLSTLRIMGEIIAEMFSEDTLLKMSGVDLKIADDVRRAVEKVPKPPEPEMPPPQPGMPPPNPQQQQQLMAQMQAQGQAAFQQMQQQVAAKTQAEKMKEFQDAVALLKSDKMRGFRVDIETDSTIVSDAQADKEAAVELTTGVMQALTAAGPIVMTAPELMKPIGDLIMWSYRKFRVGRSVEAGLEDALDQLNDRIEAQKNQPPPPDPEQIKAQAQVEGIKAKTEGDVAKTQAGLQADQQKAQIDAQAQAQKSILEMQKLQADMRAEAEKTAMELTKMREELAIERERMQLEREAMLTKAAVDANATAQGAEAADHQHALDMETAEFKAAEARKPKPKTP